jgi:hypothetical protein
MANLNPAILSVYDAMELSFLPSSGTLPLQDWYNIAIGLINAIDHGLAHANEHRDELGLIINQEWFHPAHKWLTEALTHTTACSGIDHVTFQQNLEHWHVQQAAAAHTALKGSIEAEVSTWRHNHFKELKARAEKEIEAEIAIWADTR